MRQTKTENSGLPTSFLMLSRRFCEFELWELETSQRPGYKPGGQAISPEVWLLSDYGPKSVVCEQLTLKIGQNPTISVVFLESSTLHVSTWKCTFKV